MRDIRLVIPLRLRNFGVGRELGFLPGLLGLRGLDHRIPVRFRLGDLCVAFHLRNPRLAQRVEVALAVPNVLDREADDAQTHVRHIAGSDFLNFRGESVAILVNVFHRHRAQDRPQMAFQSLIGDVLNVLSRFAEELLRGGRDRDVVTLDLDLRHPIHSHGHAFAGIDILLLLHVNG